MDPEPFEVFDAAKIEADFDEIFGRHGQLVGLLDIAEKATAPRPADVPVDPRLGIRHGGLTIEAQHDIIIRDGLPGSVI